VFHTVDPTLLKAVGAWGFWAQIVQTIGGGFRLGAAYGLDDPNEDDLAPVARERNQAVLLTGWFEVNKQLGFGAEASRWWTNYVGQDTGPDAFTPAGYDRAYKSAIEKFDAIHRLTEQIAPDKIGLALSRHGAKVGTFVRQDRERCCPRVPRLHREAR